MFLAASETRLVFYQDGLAAAGHVLAVAGAALFWGLLAHWVVRRRAWLLVPLLAVPPLLVAVGWWRQRRGEAPGGPTLPWWQILAGLALAAILWPVASAARADPGTTSHIALASVMALAAGTWIVFFYLRVYRWLGRAPMGVLLAMRLLAVLVLLLLIFKPTLSEDELIVRRTELHLLLDTSRSMSIRDWPDTPNRLAHAAGRIEQYRERLAESFDLHTYAFDARVKEVESGETLEPTGEATNLSRAIREVAARARPRRTTGIVVFSDGIHNAGGSIEREVAAAAPPPVYPVVMGTDLSAASGYQDIFVTGVDAPDESVVDNVTRITVGVEGVGLGGRSVRVELAEDDTVLATRPLRLDAREGPQKVTLNVTPAETGRHTYTVRIPVDPAERRAENNTRQVHVLVTDPKIRVLYIEGTLRPEYKPLRSVLESDPNADLLSLVQVRQGEFLRSGTMQGIELTGFPQTLDDMKRFDVFIVGDLDRSYFSSAQMENLRLAVSEGRGLLMLGGYHSFGPGGYGDTPVERMLPVEVGSRSMGQETTPFVLDLTPAGRRHPIFHNTQDFFQAGDEGPAQVLPRLRGCTILGDPKRGAEVLAVHPTRERPGGEPLVVMAAQTYGKGRTVAFAADTTYQWYLPFRAMGKDSPYVRFWRQMIRYLADEDVKDVSDEPGVTVLVRKPVYQPGDEILVRAKVRGREGRATNYADVNARLMGPDVDRTVALGLVPASVGTYEKTIQPLDPGEYELLVEARLEGTAVGRETVRFSVGRPNQEFEKLSADRAALQRLADATGGELYEPATFGDLVERLRAETIQEEVHRETGLETLPGAFAILFGTFLLLVTAEWLGRKYVQLN